MTRTFLPAVLSAAAALILAAPAAAAPSSNPLAIFEFFRSEKMVGEPCKRTTPEMLEMVFQGTNPGGLSLGGNPTQPQIKHALEYGYANHCFEQFQSSLRYAARETGDGQIAAAIDILIKKKALAPVMGSMLQYTDTQLTGRPSLEPAPSVQPSLPAGQRRISGTVAAWEPRGDQQGTLSLLDAQGTTWRIRITAETSIDDDSPFEPMIYLEASDVGGIADALVQDDGLEGIGWSPDVTGIRVTLNRH